MFSLLSNVNDDDNDVFDHCGSVTTMKQISNCNVEEMTQTWTDPLWIILTMILSSICRHLAKNQSHITALFASDVNDELGDRIGDNSSCDGHKQENKEKVKADCFTNIAQNVRNWVFDQHNHLVVGARINHFKLSIMNSKDRYLRKNKVVE